jgi:hypothetical protein
MKVFAKVCPFRASFLAAICLAAVCSSAAQTPAPSLQQQAQPALVHRLPDTGASPADLAPLPPVTVLENTLIRVITNDTINSKRIKSGAGLEFTISEDVMVGNVLAIPRGATARGAVVASQKAGILTGSPKLTLQLRSLTLGDHTYPITTYQFRVVGASKTVSTKKKVETVAGVGVIGGAGVSISAADGSSAAPGRLAGAAAGATVGAGVGALASAATPGPTIWIPAESQIDFNLAAPIAITPLSAKEANRLRQGIRPGGFTVPISGENP